MASETPEGWYDDPSASNQLRYWDGQRWSGYIAPRSFAPGAPAAGRPGLAVAVVVSGLLAIALALVVVVTAAVLSHADTNKKEPSFEEALRSETLSVDQPITTPPAIPGADEAVRPVRGYRLRYSKKLTTRDRRNFRIALSRGKPAARGYVARLRLTYPVEIRIHHRYSSFSEAYSVRDRKAQWRYVVDFNSRHLRNRDRQIMSFIVWHELGHLVNFDQLNNNDLRRFRRDWRRSRRWRKCFNTKQSRSYKRCTPLAEIFADQFAFWATGDHSLISYYGDPPLSSGDRFAARLRREASPLWR